jgi:predicted helicase
MMEKTGYKFDSGKRLEIILTNTLDAPERKSEVFLEEYISEESDRAVAIKRDQPVMLVIGNPPYSYESENTGEWILLFPLSLKRLADKGFWIKHST